MNDLLAQSREIIAQALADYQPYAVVAMMSGGNDSRLAYEVAKVLGVRIDFILHGITRTGIFQTTEHVRRVAMWEGVPYIEADAGTAYEDSVLKLGFGGRGQAAHARMYHRLKAGPFRSAVSRHIRHRKRNRNILFLSGARGEESENRTQNIAGLIKPDPVIKSNIWVPLCWHWSRAERDAFLSERRSWVNPVTKLLCRSGECLCGTSQNFETRAEAAAAFPEWGKWLRDLENRVYANGFTWGWGQDVPASFALEKAGQTRMFETEFQPMCVGCNRDLATSTFDLPDIEPDCAQHRREGEAAS